MVMVQSKSSHTLVVDTPLITKTVGKSKTVEPLSIIEGLIFCQ